MSRAHALSLAAVFASVPLLACNCGGGPGPTDGGEDGGTDAGELIPTTNAEHDQMLEALGFTTALGPRLDPAKRPVPDAYHPLGSRFSTFHPRAELYLAGFTLEGKREHLFDDSSKGFARLDFTAKEDDAWTTASFKNGVSGDFDGDGLDEIFIAYYVNATHKLRYVVLDLDGDAVKEGELDASVSADALDMVTSPSLAAGDLDGDGRDEVAVGFARFYLVDKLEAEPMVTVKVHDDQDLDDVFVAMGNLDWDGADELVVTWRSSNGGYMGHYAIYDGSFETPTQTGTLTPVIAGVSHVVRETAVAIGNVDDDRLGEIVFAGLAEGNAWALFILEYNRPSDNPLYAWKSFWTQPAGWAAPWPPRPLFVLDWNGDGKKEIFMNTSLFQVTSAQQATRTDIGFGETLRRALPGDVDGDGRDDIIYEWGAVSAYGLNSLDVPAHKKTWAGSPTTTWSTVIVPANVDADSAVVRYDGEHELLFSDPHVVAVLASPPYHVGIDQNVASTATTFGKMSGQTVETTKSLGISTGFSVGYEADFSIFGSAEFTATVEQSLDFIAGSSTTIQKYHSYTTGPGEDKVVFTTVPFDVYYYVIVASPDARDVGRTVSINVPREPQTLSTTRAFYNSHNGGGLDVDARILRHTPGDVWSYPTIAERDALLSAAEARDHGYHALWNGPMPVGEGGGFHTLGINATEGSSRGASMDFSVKFEFSATSPGGAKSGSSIGFHYGESYTFETEDTAVFEGTVGDIPAAGYTAENRYQFGLFVYPDAVAGQKFLVMNWWTQP